MENIDFLKAIIKIQTKHNLKQFAKWVDTAHTLTVLKPGWLLLCFELRLSLNIIGIKTDEQL